MKYEPLSIQSLHDCSNLHFGLLNGHFWFNPPLPSGNQTWLAGNKQYGVIFPLKPPFILDFQLPFLMTPEGMIAELVQNNP